MCSLPILGRNGQPLSPDLADQISDLRISHLPEPVSDASKAPDPFDPDQLRLSQDFGASLGIEKVLTSVPVRKPSKEAWIQVHPDDNFHLRTFVIDLKDEGEIYLVDQLLWPNLQGEATFSRRHLFTTVTRQGKAFIWPIRLPGPNGKINSWNADALQAAEMARGKWIRISANMETKAYDVVVAPNQLQLQLPQWPKESFRELFQIAFKDKFIDSMDHIVLRKLRGEV